MGQTPAKYFAPPLPYGSSPDVGVLQQAKAAAPAPLNNFLPLNPPDPSQQATQGTQSPAQGQLGGLATGFKNPNIYNYGAQQMKKFYDY